MMLARRVLGLDAARWKRVGPASFWSAVSFAVGASAIIALNRFGGLVIDAPRAFARLTLIGVYGWLGLTIAVWLCASGLRAATNPGAVTPPPALGPTLVAVGVAHSPVLLVGMVTFAAAGIFQVLGPGLVVAVFVFAFWFPATLVAAARYSLDLGLRRSLAVVVMPYLVWLLVVGRHLLGQIQHLL